MTDEFGRAVAFFSGMQDRMAQRTVSSRFGTALFNDDLPRVYYLNVLRVDDGPEAPRAEDLLRETDALQAGLGHRKFELNDERGAALEEHFRALGWKVERALVMVHRGGGREGDLGKALEVAAADLRATWEQGIRDSPYGTDEDVVRQLVEAQLLRESAVDVRYFAAHEDSRPVSECSLFSDGPIAQIESVQTLEPYRGRGYASATITKAIREAQASGHELIFLLADDEDWPKELYSKLGFEAVGRVWEFVKEPEPRRTDPT
jgi:GNAT superfamily N-acetyltransferase